jgi:hypothetical protein
MSIRPQVITMWSGGCPACHSQPMGYKESIIETPYHPVSSSLSQVLCCECHEVGVSNLKINH